VDGAVKSFDRALLIARETGLAKEEADWRKGKATTLAVLGRYDAALREYAEAEKVYQHSGLQRELVEALNDTGNVYELLGDGVSADLRFQQALQLAQKIGHTAGESASLLALGDLERRRKRNEPADKYFERALERARAARDEGSTITALDSLREMKLLLTSLNRRFRKHWKPAAWRSNQETGPPLRSRNMSSAKFAGHRRNSEALEAYAAADDLQKQLRGPSGMESAVWPRPDTRGARKER
jgi:tetratricopeptide (TPR) repeat protein